MKKSALVLLLLLNVNLGQANPLQTVWHICRNIGYRNIVYGSVICGIGYYIARYNDYRNSAHTTQFQYSADGNDLMINTDGNITIHRNARGKIIRTELQNPDTQHYSLLPDSRQGQVTVENKWRQLWHWLIRPPYRAIAHPIIFAP